MNNTINISSQNITLAQAQSSSVDNPGGYFQVVAFYCASASGNRPNATGLTIKFDPRLTVLDADESHPFSSVVYNTAGQRLANRGRGATQEVIDHNLFFAATANDDPYAQDGYLYFARVQFPNDVEVGDVFPITIELEDEDNNPYEFLYVDSTATAQEQADMIAWTKANGILNGGFTVV